MRDFEFLEPASPGEASRMLADSGEDSRLYAGGTALILAMRQRMLTPSHLVYLGGVQGLGEIAFDQRGLSIGTLARHAQVADSPVVKKHFPMLSAMAAHLANPQVRNQATIGGNLCYGDPATDPPGCLLALGARVYVTGPQGERVIALDDFFTDYFQTALDPHEVLTRIEIPPPAEGSKGAYSRFLRTPAEHRPLVSVAVVANRAGAVCRKARIVIGASVTVPTRARHAEQFLEGKTVTLETLEEAAQIAATKDVEPISDFRGTAEYRRDTIRTVLRRTAASVFDL